MSQMGSSIEILESYNVLPAGVEVKLATRFQT